MSKRFITFFVAVVFSLFLCSAIASAQMPDRTPEKFTTTEWATYFRSVLHKYDPEDTELIDRVRIIVTRSVHVETSSCWFLNPPVIVVDFKLIKMFDNEDECAAVLLHELGHVKLKQFPAITINDYGEVESDQELLFEYERDADKFSQQKMINSSHGGCANYIFAKKSFGQRLNPFDPEQLVMIKRLELMLSDCKESMPYVPGKPSPNEKP